MNTHVRDNLRETAAATATTAGDIVFADGANSMGSRVGIGSARSLMVSTGSAPAWRTVVEAANYFLGSTSQTDTNTGFGNVWGTDQLPKVTVTTGTAALVFGSAMAVSNSTGGSLTGIALRVNESPGGALTIDSGDATGAYYESSNNNDRSAISVIRLLTGLTAGANTFTMDGRCNSGVGTIERPRIAVIPL
jgi:hypothetical protein